MDWLSWLWVLSVASAANVAPVFLAKISFLSPFGKPIDGGKNIRGIRVLGDNKTWLGILFPWVFGLLVALVFQWFFLSREYTAHETNVTNYRISSEIFVQNYFLLSSVLIALSVGVADLIKSFVKRRLGIAPGNTWLIWDQCDWIVGAMIALAVLDFVTLSWLGGQRLVQLFENSMVTELWFWMLLPAGLIVHLLAKYVGYLLHINSKPI